MDASTNQETDTGERKRGSSTYGLLEAGEVDGEGALVAAGAERRHRHVGDHRRHHEGAQAEEESEHQQVPQPRRGLLHLPLYRSIALSSPSFSPTMYVYAM